MNTTISNVLDIILIAIMLPVGVLGLVRGIRNRRPYFFIWAYLGTVGLLYGAIMSRYPTRIFAYIMLAVSAIGSVAIVILNHRSKRYRNDKLLRSFLELFEKRKNWKEEPTNGGQDEPNEQDNSQEGTGTSGGQEADTENSRIVSVLMFATIVLVLVGLIMFIHYFVTNILPVILSGQS